MHYMKWIYPRRLRNQMILMAILMVIVPTLTIGYIVETEGRSAVLSEKEKKLSAVVNLLNQALGNRYDLYIDLPREERIRALNAELAPITENITHAFPGIGAGYYNKTLDAIITYAPSALYQNNVGVTIAADHPGREVDAPRDKCTLSCAINGIHAAFHYLKKNYISGCVMTVPTG